MFAAAATLWTLAVGAHPYGDASSDAARPSSDALVWPAELSQALGAALRRGLARDPGARWPDALSFRDALARIRATAPCTTTASRPCSSRRVALSAPAWRYAGGSACTALAGETAAIGRGSFQVQSATLVGPLCHIRVSGSVTTTIAANTVTRTIDGDLTAGGGAGGWAVGAVDGGELIIRWDGSSWSRAGPYGGIPNVELNSVHCASGNDCWAVGTDSGGELIIHWDGSSWSRSGPYGGIPNKELYSVHCVASNDCWAVGEAESGELIIHWNGTTWSRAGPYGSIPDKPFYSVHCVSGNDCWAVGEAESGELIIHWNGSTWSRAGTSGSIPDKTLYSVHCVAGNDCWAVGEVESGELIIHWNGSSWSRSGPYGSVPNETLNSVHCAASNDCWAVGERSGYENINHWNGSAWTRIGNTSSIANKNLNSVYMVSTTEGYLVGKMAPSPPGTVAAGVARVRRPEAILTWSTHPVAQVVALPWCTGAR